MISPFFAIILGTANKGNDSFGTKPMSPLQHLMHPKSWHLLLICGGRQIANL